MINHYVLAYQFKLKRFNPIKINTETKYFQKGNDLKINSPERATKSSERLYRLTALEHTTIFITFRTIHFFTTKCRQCSYGVEH